MDRLRPPAGPVAGLLRVVPQRSLLPGAEEYALARQEVLEALWAGWRAWKEVRER